MLSRLRTHLGTAGLVVAIVALIAALGGGAYAATNSGESGKATASAKGKQGPRGKTGKTGPAGLAGPAGPQGAAGAAGKDGANGTNGSNGGVGATGPTGKTGNAGAVGAVGEAGPTGPTGTYGGIVLPAGVTETGYWSFHAPGTKTIEDGSGNMVTVGSSKAWVPISFTDSLEEDAAGNFLVSVTGDPDFDEVCGTGPNGAGGTPTLPKAPSKRLCIYMFQVEESNATFDNVAGHPANLEEASRSLKPTGAVMQFSATAEGPAKGAGTWAVTG